MSACMYKVDFDSAHIYSGVHTKLARVCVCVQRIYLHLCSAQWLFDVLI